ncbi:MAG TPA: ribbon-helix-helix domain-containing protein [Candidatus Competibacteraceae bacterium]|nr:MAG: ribbon-helix-helix protein, CopG family [Candidatus Competibacteraceae bacterium]HOB62415.1 ribbon-helix-helix domain-containing protein [Candidatus Competibacteraceae bacterium]HQD57546.1 ribbon-helix-helix domain-containing protein [Candidatus Competibacteraceae bacterium]
MRTVQITLEEELVQAVDRAASRLALTRSAFARDALRAGLLQRYLGVCAQAQHLFPLPEPIPHTPAQRTGRRHLDA